MSPFSANFYRPARGITLMELMVSLAVMSGILVLVMESMRVMAGDCSSTLAQSDLSTRTSGTIYDMITELRQATAYSPNFYIEEDPTRPPIITFDQVSGVDSKGNIKWGNKVSYVLQLAPASQTNAFDYLDIDVGQLVRIETTPKGVSSTFLLEAKVPYHYSEGGVPYWGFMVKRDGCALFISLSRFADAGKTTGHVYKNISDSSTASANLAIVRFAGNYFLRNPQSIVTLK